MFLGRGEDEDRMSGRLLQRLKESVEGGLRKHMHLVDDVDAVLSHLRRDTHLFDQQPDILHGVIGSRIEFMDVV